MGLTSTKLLYVSSVSTEGMLSWYVTSQWGQLSFLTSAGCEMNTVPAKQQRQCSVTTKVWRHTGHVTQTLVYLPMGSMA